jgi:putative NIF3 family GTP cyclohydrolase 1 type 2
MTAVSRRHFVFGTAATWLASRALPAQSRGLTAQAVADRIRAAVGVPWRDRTVDGFKAGDPATVVTGVATTVMATLDVLRRAAAARQNLIVTLEPTFYAADDAVGNRAADAVYLAKRNFIDQQRLVIWRFTDHWSARQPNEAASALARTMGWGGDGVAGAPQTYRLPPTTLGALASQLRSRLGARGGLRVVGQSGMRVRTVFVSPGTTDLPTTVANLRNVDAIVAGEPREWEAVPYALDSWSAGQGQARALIAVGRVVSEGPGMRACAAWIRTVIPGTRVEFVANTDPYWSPAR